MRYIRYADRYLNHVLVLPIITSVFIPMVILDLWIEMYHRTCFYLCGIPYIDRDAYIVFDRAKLPYLDFFQKGYCLYCSYANGVIKYWGAIAGATEAYWCGIQHQKNPKFNAPEHQEVFVPYGDVDAFTAAYVAPADLSPEAYAKGEEACVVESADIKK